MLALQVQEKLCLQKLLQEKLEFHSFQFLVQISLKCLWVLVLLESETFSKELEKSNHQLYLLMRLMQLLKRDMVNLEGMMKETIL